MNKQEKGAIVVEATIALTSFIFFIYILLTVINVCLAQAKIGIAVNAAAKELSQYCYLYSLTGVEKISANLEEKGQVSDGVVDDVADGIETVYGELENMAGGNSSVGSVKNSASNAYNSFKSGASTVSEDPKQFIMSLIFASANDLFQAGKNSVGGLIVKNLVKKNLRSNTEGTNLDASVEYFLKHCGVVPDGDSYLGGLDFGATEIMPQGAENNLVIKIVADYEIRFIRLLNLDLTVHMNACGTTQAWAVGDTPTSKELSDGSKKDDSNEGNESTTSPESTEPDTTLPESTEVETTKKLSAKEYAADLTKNPNADKAFIGPGADSIAKVNNATYLDTNNLAKIENEIGEKDAWDIQKEFMYSQIEKKKKIFLTEDPNNASGEYKKQVQYLKDHGYKLKEDIEFWVAVPKTLEDY